nr:pentapeptide repeat-containing protein [Leucobacter exalbidus]
MAHLEPGDFDAVEAHEYYEGQRYEAANAEGRDLQGVTFTECEFLSLTSGDKLDLRAAGIIESRFERLNAPTFQALRSRWRDVTIESSRLGFADFAESSLHSMHFINCKLGFVNLRASSVQDVLFTNCTIDEIDLGGAKTNRVSFVDTEVGTLDVTRATLKHTDLRGLLMRKIVGLEGLRGATMSDYQITQLAPLFAAQIGIQVAG